MSTSSRRIWPSVGRSKPAIMRRVVVLPQPDGPRSEKNSPDGMSRLIPATAVNSPKRFTRSTSWTSPPAIARGAYLWVPPASQPDAAEKGKGEGPGRPGNRDRAIRAARLWSLDGFEIPRAKDGVDRLAGSADVGRHPARGCAKHRPCRYVHTSPKPHATKNSGVAPAPRKDLARFAAAHSHLSIVPFVPSSRRNSRWLLGV